MSIFPTIPYKYSQLLFYRPWMTPYMLPVIQLTLTGSVWTTVAVSVERYLSVCRSYRSDHRIHLFYTAPILAASFLFNGPRVLELTTVMTNTTIGDNQTVAVPMAVPTDLRLDLSYRRDYVTVANSLFLIVLPFITLIVLNSLIFRTITQATRRHNAISSNQRYF